MRRQTEQIEGVGAPPMEGQNRRVWPGAGGFVQGVNELHEKLPPIG